jgi:hypothetical protein
LNHFGSILILLCIIATILFLIFIFLIFIFISFLHFLSFLLHTYIFVFLWLFDIRIRLITIIFIMRSDSLCFWLSLWIRLGIYSIFVVISLFSTNCLPHLQMLSFYWTLSFTKLSIIFIVIFMIHLYNCRINHNIPQYLKLPFNLIQPINRIPTTLRPMIISISSTTFFIPITHPLYLWKIKTTYINFFFILIKVTLTTSRI